MDACSRKPVETAAEAAKVVAWAVVGARENSLHGIASELAFVGAYLTRPAADPGEYGELAKLMERMGLARDMLSGHLMPDAANAVSAGIDRLGTQAADIARLREAGEKDKERYTWLANAVLYCDYGDNEHGGADSPDRIGWGVQLSRRNSEPFIFGQSIDAAIDAALSPNPTSP